MGIADRDYMKDDLKKNKNKKKYLDLNFFFKKIKFFFWRIINKK